ALARSPKRIAVRFALLSARMFLGHMLLGGASVSIHVVINRAARHLRGDTPLARTIRAAATGATVYETAGLSDLDAAAKAVFEAKGSTVVLCGGDGSYMAGVTALRRAFGERPLPKIALGPGGTVSTVARNWGMSGPLDTYAKRILRVAIEGDGHTVLRPTMRVRDDGGGDRIGFIFGAGLVAQFFDVYDSSAEQGYSGAAKIVARIFGGSFVGGALAKKVLAPVPCTLNVDGKNAPANAYSLIVASVVRDLGLHMQVLYRAGEDHARVHLVASALGPFSLGPQLPLVIAGKRLRGRDHVDALARSFRVTFENPSGYVLDGDVLHARQVDVEAGPELRLIQLSA
ncbi:MAG: diacylglycerol kinase family protein, partial [Polyangiaceae bacterium]